MEGQPNRKQSRSSFGEVLYDLYLLFCERRGINPKRGVLPFEQAANLGARAIARVLRGERRSLNARSIDDAIEGWAKGDLFHSSEEREDWRRRLHQLRPESRKPPVESEGSAIEVTPDEPPDPAQAAYHAAMAQLKEEEFVVRAYIAGGSSNLGHGYAHLAGLLARQLGREAEAEEAYHVAIAESDNEHHKVELYRQLAKLMARQPGREADVAVASRKVDDLWAALREADAARASRTAELTTRNPPQEFRAAIAAGHFPAAREATKALDDPLAPRGPQSVRGIKFGWFGEIGANDLARYIQRGELLARTGERAEAESIYHAIGSAGYPRGYLLLANLLVRQPGREAEAERAYRQAIAWYDRTNNLVEVYVRLAELLARRPGRAAEAEGAYRAAAEAGPDGTSMDGKDSSEFKAKAYTRLSQYLARQPGREAEAEDASRAATQAGVAATAVREAEREYRAAIATGDASAYRALADLLARQLGRETVAAMVSRAAELVEREAAAVADHASPKTRAILEAELASRAAIAAGDVTAYCALADLCAQQPGREEEAEAAYCTADDLGNPTSHIHLSNLLMRQPGREKEAKAVYRAARERRSLTDAG